MTSNRLIEKGRPTLLTVSGGIDSVVMAQLFRETDYPFGIAHCNFQLRGAASDGDEAFVQQLASAWDVPFFVKRFETKAYAEKNSLSIQMAARELRYAWFREIASENGYTRIATAHNLNDSVETALLNFVRGTGLSGLRGIAVSASSDLSRNRDVPPDTRDTPLVSGEETAVIRPLLFASRTDIEAWAKMHHLHWREDSSNVDVDYARNYIRHRVIPLLEELNPNFLHTATRNLLRLRETDDNLHFLLQHFFEDKNSAGTGRLIDKQKLAQLPAPRRALREMLKHFGFTEEQTRQLADNPDHIGLELHSNSGWRLINDREHVLLVSARSPIPDTPFQTIQSDDLMVTLPGGGRLVLMYTDTVVSFPDSREAALMDAEKLHFPLLLRPWQPGDVFQPLGMNGHRQKLQDYFTNLKLSRLDKEKIRVLENGDGNIIWVVGHRADERFKVTSDTKKFLKITCL